MWGTEISYGTYSKAGVGVSPGASGNWQLSGFQFSGTGTFPLGSEFALIGKIGIARTKIKATAAIGAYSFSESATSTKAAFGIGAQYHFSKGVAIRTQYEDLGKFSDDNTTSTGNVRLLSAGAVIKF